MKKLSSIFIVLFLLPVFAFSGELCFSGNYTSDGQVVQVKIHADAELEPALYFLVAEFTVNGKPEKNARSTFFCKISDKLVYFGKSAGEITTDKPDGSLTADGKFKWTNPRYL